MGKKDYLARQQELYRANYNAGLNDGIRIALEMISLVLHDPEIMRKDTFGKMRLQKVAKGMWDKLRFYIKAWLKDDEADYYREKLDQALKDAYGGTAPKPFSERYTRVLEYDYWKGKWKRRK